MAGRGRRKRKKSSGQEDYISNLPDFIIGHILSFLSTKFAVRTSILSKRWKHTWTFVTKLSFSDAQNPHSRLRIKQFSDFVTRVLFHINRGSIQQFRLSIGPMEYGADYINQWLSTVLNTGVKSITLNSFNTNNFHLSSYPLFQSPSLQELNLQMIFPFIIKLPTFIISLPSLTVLTLSHITFSNHSSSVQDLTLKLPLLRTFWARYCTWLGVNRVTFEAPLLENVRILESARKTKFMSHTQIKFCASNLTNFVYHNCLSLLSHSQTFLVDGHIASADIFLQSFGSTSVEEETSLFVSKLLSLFTNTKSLVLCFDPLKRMGQVEHHLADDFAFQTLGHLQLTSATGEVLLSLLLKSPCLKTLVLEDQVDISDEGVQNFARVPDCFRSTLKVVKFENFLGGVCELSFAKFVMENTLVLERISFLFNHMLTCSEVEKLKEKLLLFKKSSSTVIMEFSDTTPPMSVEHKTVEGMPDDHVKMSQAGPSRPRRRLA